MTAEIAAEKPAPKGGRKPSIFNDRRRMSMLLLGIASGLPFTVVGGTLSAWFTASHISTATIGVLSWSALSYSFNFLWSPVMHRTLAPVTGRMGLRRGWFVPLQVLISLCLLGFSALDPTKDLPLIAACAVAASFLSATFDICINAWRIETARNADDVNALTTLYSAGYRSSALIGGAGALILSQHVGDALGARQLGWQVTMAVLAVLMLLTIFGSILAPEPPRAAADAEKKEEERLADTFPTQWRNIVVLLVLVGWAWAFWTLGSFMFAAVQPGAKVNAGAFTKVYGPWIVFVTVLAPALGSIWLLRMRAKPMSLGLPQLPAKSQGVADTLFRAVIEPLVELIGRKRWSALLALGLILFYNFPVSIWASFAYPFYMGDKGGALGHTQDEVALASKIIGVIATIGGVAFGGVVLKVLGRQVALIAGAAGTGLACLLFADLASGAPVIDGFLNLTHLMDVFRLVRLDERMAQLCTGIVLENVAVGAAGVIYVAFLTAIVNKKYAAVQYALLGSLTMLVGQLGRPALGQLIDTQGFALAFLLAASMGVVPVALAIGEWIRTSREPKPEPAKEQPAPAE
jgi:PAT family beta-lactamase induction signal transducer AmpG